MYEEKLVKVKGRRGTKDKEEEGHIFKTSN